MLPELADSGAPYLLPQHQKLLDASAISAEVAAARGYLSVVDAKHLEALGFSNTQSRCVPVLYIPIWNVHGELGTHQIRPDNPRTFANGRTAKYQMAKGDRACLDVNPLVRSQLADPAKDLFVTEGSRKADSLISAGLCALGLLGVFGFRGSNSAGGTTALGDWESVALKGRNIYLVFDSDVTRKPTVQTALRRLYRFLKSRGAIVRIVYLPETDGGPKVGVDDFLSAGHTPAELRELAEPDLRSSRVGAIETNNRQLPAISRDAFEALLAYNDPPQIFVYSGNLSRVVVDENGQAAIAPLTSPALRGYLARAAEWVSTSERRGAVDVMPPIPVVEDILAMPDYPGIPALSGIVHAPVFGPDGSVALIPGYHRATGYWLQASTDFHIPDTPPTPQSVQDAVVLLRDDLLGDFSFADESSRAHAVAFIIQPFVRPLILGPTPIYLYDAPKAGTGKGLLVEVSVGVFTETVSLTPPPHNDEEHRKVITSIFASGASHAIFDNARRLDSVHLYGAITAPYWKDRLLGTNKMGNYPVQLNWAATCNNVDAKDELTRRAVWIRLDSGVENPDERGGFRHPDLLGWSREHRMDLIAAVLTIVRAWFEADCPAYSGRNAPMGKFERWTEVIGGILEVAGIDGFLDNRNKLKSSTDNETTAWKGFVVAWFMEYGTKSVAGAQLFEFAQEWFPEKLGEGSERSQRSKLGKLLNAHIDRVFDGKKILRDGEATSGDYKGAALYQLGLWQHTGEHGEHGEHGEGFLLPSREYPGNQNHAHTTSTGERTCSPCSPCSPSVLTGPASGEAEEHFDKPPSVPEKGVILYEGRRWK